MVSDEALRHEISNILKHGDPEKLTTKMVRQQLEQTFSVDLLSAKEKITQFVKDEMLHLQNQEESEDDEGGHKTGRGSGFRKEVHLSATLAAIVNSKYMARGDVTKYLWKYIKDNNLQNPQDKRRIMCDAKLKALFHVDDISMFLMSKCLSHHMANDPNGPFTEVDPHEVGDAERKIVERRDEPPKERKQKNVKGGKGVDKKGKKEPTKRKGNPEALNVPMQLSPELSSIMGTSVMSRPAVVKSLWDYIKQRELQDPSDKRKIICDESMRRVFNCDEMTMFSMNKELSRHLTRVQAA